MVKNMADKKQFNRIRRSIVMIMAIGLLVATGIYTYAKYYAQSVKSGIAIASGVYFTSNYAVEALPESHDFFESIITVGYAGGDYSYDFEVRNYENNLLFNESAIVIPYSVSFWILEQPDSAKYYVSYDGGMQRELVAGVENKVDYLYHSIGGGSAKVNKYNITIDAVDGTVHVPVPIYVEVTTEPGAVLDRTLRGKMVLNSSVRNDTYIESQEFVVANDTVVDTEKFAQIKELSEFTYEIRTVGAVSDEESMTEKLKLTWDPDILEIDQYDDSYTKWKEETGRTVPLETAEGLYYITIDVMPYSASVVYFFRGENFDSVTSMATLNDAIEAEKYSYIGN